jgi:hypothetical protein
VFLTPPAHSFAAAPLQMVPWAGFEKPSLTHASSLSDTLFFLLSVATL